jgi:hypothetical protein
MSAAAESIHTLHWYEHLNLRTKILKIKSQVTDVLGLLANL